MTEVPPINFLNTPPATTPADVPIIVVPAIAPIAPKAKRFVLLDEWHWIVSHSWSLRFTFGAFLLSGLEVALPLLTDLQGLPGYPILIGLTTAGAFVARLFAQNHPGVGDEA